MNKPQSEYPSEHLVPLEGHEHLLGRLTINLVHDGLSVEVDIVQKEGRKIWATVKRLYQVSDFHEALYLGMQELSSFLQKRQ